MPIKNHQRVLKWGKLLGIKLALEYFDITDNPYHIILLSKELNIKFKRTIFKLYLLNFSEKLS